MWYAQRQLEQLTVRRAVPLSIICFALVSAATLAAVSLTDAGTFIRRGESQHDKQLRDERRSSCPGPVLQPAERPEAGNRKFAKQLSEEAASLDAEKVPRVQASRL